MTFLSAILSSTDLIVSSAEYFSEDTGLFSVSDRSFPASSAIIYWNWYGFTTYQEWCACFVSWCGEQAGLIERRAMPRFSLCSDGMSWFQSHGKWQAAGSTPTVGSLIFFDWGGDGVPDHVAIVEKCENGVVYTIEGNTSTRVNGESVRGVWQHQYASNYFTSSLSEGFVS